MTEKDEMLGRNVTMAQVAKAAGVSVSSVSHLYNRPHKLSAQQREHITQIAHELGYSGPNPTARSLRRGRTGAWGLLLNERLSFAFNDPTTLALLRGIGMTCDDMGISLSILPTLEAWETGREDLIREAQIDGFIAYFLDERSPVFSEAHKRHLPIVTVDSPALPGCAFVGIDDEWAAKTGAAHLLALGHRKFCILVDRLSPDGRTGFVTADRVSAARDVIAQTRVAAWLREIGEAGIDPAIVPVYEAGGYSTQTASAAAAQVCRRAEATAFIASSDILAGEVMREMARLGRRPGVDYSVVGFDDIPGSDALGLTTIRQPLEEKGRVSAELLANMLAGGKPAHIVMPALLVTRSSTGPVSG